MWQAFYYSEIFPGRLSAVECNRVIALHQGQGLQRSRMPRGDGGFIRNSDLFWIPRTAETDWKAVAGVVERRNLPNAVEYPELLAEMGQLQGHTAHRNDRVVGISSRARRAGLPAERAF